MSSQGPRRVLCQQRIMGQGSWKRRSGDPEADELSQGLDSRWRGPQGLADGESIGVCHRVAERFRGMTNRKPVIQQYLAHGL